MRFGDWMEAGREQGRNEMSCEGPAEVGTGGEGGFG